VFLVNSRLGLLIATLNCFGGELLHSQRHPFSRSYGVILPSSLDRVLSIALESSSHLPASVCGTGTCVLPRGFSRKLGISHYASLAGSSPSVSGLNAPTDLPIRAPYTSAGHIQSSGWPTLLRPPIGITNARWYWNVNQLSIAYALRPRLRPD
jgi:hypothetical protein